MKGNFLATKRRRKIIAYSVISNTLRNKNGMVEKKFSVDASSAVSGNVFLKFFKREGVTNEFSDYVGMEDSEIEFDKYDMPFFFTIQGSMDSVEDLEISNKTFDLEKYEKIDSLESTKLLMKLYLPWDNHVWETYNDGISSTSKLRRTEKTWKFGSDFGNVGKKFGYKINVVEKKKVSDFPRVSILDVAEDYVLQIDSTISKQNTITGNQGIFGYYGVGYMFYDDPSIRFAKGFDGNTSIDKFSSQEYIKTGDSTISEIPSFTDWSVGRESFGVDPIAIPESVESTLFNAPVSYISKKLIGKIELISTSDPIQVLKQTVDLKREQIIFVDELHGVLKLLIGTTYIYAKYNLSQYKRMNYIPGYDMNDNGLCNILVDYLSSESQSIKLEQESFIAKYALKLTLYNQTASPITSLSGLESKSLFPSTALTVTYAFSANVKIYIKKISEISNPSETKVFLLMNQRDDTNDFALNIADATKYIVIDEDLGNDIIELGSYKELLDKYKIKAFSHIHDLLEVKTIKVDQGSFVYCIRFQPVTETTGTPVIIDKEMSIKTSIAESVDFIESKVVNVEKTIEENNKFFLPMNSNKEWYIYNDNGHVRKDFDAVNYAIEETIPITGAYFEKPYAITSDTSIGLIRTPIPYNYVNAINQETTCAFLVLKPDKIELSHIFDFSEMKNDPYVEKNYSILDSKFKKMMLYDLVKSGCIVIKFKNILEENINGFNNQGIATEERLYRPRCIEIVLNQDDGITSYNQSSIQVTEKYKFKKLIYKDFGMHLAIKDGILYECSKFEPILKLDNVDYDVFSFFDGDCVFPIHSSFALNSLKLPAYGRLINAPVLNNWNAYGIIDTSRTGTLLSAGNTPISGRTLLNSEHLGAFDNSSSKIITSSYLPLSSKTIDLTSSNQVVFAVDIIITWDGDDDIDQAVEDYINGGNLYIGVTSSTRHNRQFSDSKLFKMRNHNTVNLTDNLLPNNYTNKIYDHRNFEDVAGVNVNNTSFPDDFVNGVFNSSGTIGGSSGFNFKAAGEPWAEHGSYTYMKYVDGKPGYGILERFAMDYTETGLNSTKSGNSKFSNIFYKDGFEFNTPTLKNFSTSTTDSFKTSTRQKIITLYISKDKFIDYSSTFKDFYKNGYDNNITSYIDGASSSDIHNRAHHNASMSIGIPDKSGKINLLRSDYAHFNASVKNGVSISPTTINETKYYNSYYNTIGSFSLSLMVMNELRAVVQFKQTSTITNLPTLQTSFRYYQGCPFENDQWTTKKYSTTEYFNANEFNRSVTTSNLEKNIKVRASNSHIGHYPPMRKAKVHDEKVNFDQTESDENTIRIKQVKVKEESGFLNPVGEYDLNFIFYNDKVDSEGNVNGYRDWFGLFDKSGFNVKPLRGYLAALAYEDISNSGTKTIPI
jgi:hypothetical protein